MDARQKRFAREEQIARLVCDAVPGLEFGRKSESPDAILRRPDGTEIGLEVAGVVSEATHQTKRHRQEAAAAVEAERKERGLVRWLRVYFDATEMHERPLEKRPRRRWLKHTASELITIASQSPSGELGTNELRAAGIDYVAGFTWKPPTALPGVGMGWATCADHVVAADLLRAKDALIPSYRRKHPELAEVWLALEGIWPGMIDYGLDDLGQEAFESGFGRVFVVEGKRPGHDEKAREVLRDLGQSS